MLMRYPKRSTLSRAGGQASSGGAKDAQTINQSYLDCSPRYHTLCCLKSNRNLYRHEYMVLIDSIYYFCNLSINQLNMNYSITLQLLKNHEQQLG